MTDLNAALTAAACVVIVTDHDAYDWASVRRAARLRVDTRHVAYSPTRKKFKPGTFSLGIWYASGTRWRIAAPDTVRYD